MSKKIIPIRAETHGDLAKLNWSTLSDARAAASAPGVRIYRAALIVTGACNFECPYCNVLSGSRAPTLRRDKTLALVDELLALGLKELRLSGGEPTLVPWLPDLVRRASDGGARVAVSSNGYSDLEVYGRLVDAGVAEFSVSLDSADPKVADEQSGGRLGVLERVSKTIAYLSSRSIPVYVGMTCGRGKTSAQIQSTVELARSLGVHEIKMMSLSQEGEIVDSGWVTEELGDEFPLLKWRAENFKNGRDVRGLVDSDCRRCHVVLDDATVAGDFHYPCNVYFREKGAPIGKVGPDMLAERALWHESHDSLVDPICRRHCMDILREYNNRSRDLKSSPSAE